MITAALLRYWDACWSDELIAAKLAGRVSVTAREVAEDGSLSLDDRLWVLCQLIAHLDESAARAFAVESTLTVAHLAGDEGDEALFRGLMNDLMCAEDLPAEQLSAAWGAARRCAGAAARAAARAAAWDAAWAAAWGAAGAAARAAAWDAVGDAACDAWHAARAAALQNSICRALEWLGEYADAKEVDGG